MTSLNKNKRIPILNSQRPQRSLKKILKSSFSSSKGQDAKKRRVVIDLSKNQTFLVPRNKNRRPHKKQSVTGNGAVTGCSSQATTSIEAIPSSGTFLHPFDQLPVHSQQQSSTLFDNKVTSGIPESFSIFKRAKSHMPDTLESQYTAPSGVNSSMARNESFGLPQPSGTRNGSALTLAHSLKKDRASPTVRKHFPQGHPVSTIHQKSEITMNISPKRKSLAPEKSASTEQETNISLRPGVPKDWRVFDSFFDIKPDTKPNVIRCCINSGLGQSTLKAIETRIQAEKDAKNSGLPINAQDSKRIGTLQPNAEESSVASLQDYGLGDLLRKLKHEHLTKSSKKSKGSKHSYLHNEETKKASKPHKKAKSKQSTEPGANIDKGNRLPEGDIRGALDAHKRVISSLSTGPHAKVTNAILPSRNSNVKALHSHQKSMYRQLTNLDGRRKIQALIRQKQRNLYVPGTDYEYAMEQDNFDRVMPLYSGCDPRHYLRPEYWSLFPPQRPPSPPIERPVFGLLPELDFDQDLSLLSESEESIGSTRAENVHTTVLSVEVQKNVEPAQTDCTESTFTINKAQETIESGQPDNIENMLPSGKAQKRVEPTQLNNLKNILTLDRAQESIELVQLDLVDNIVSSNERQGASEIVQPDSLDRRSTPSPVAVSQPINPRGDSKTVEEVKAIARVGKEDIIIDRNNSELKSVPHKGAIKKQHIETPGSAILKPKPTGLANQNQKEDKVSGLKAYIGASIMNNIGSLYLMDLSDFNFKDDLSSYEMQAYKNPEVTPETFLAQVSALATVVFKGRKLRNKYDLRLMALLEVMEMLGALKSALVEGTLDPKAFKTPCSLALAQGPIMLYPEEMADEHNMSTAIGDQIRTKFHSRHAPLFRLMLKYSDSASNQSPIIPQQPLFVRVYVKDRASRLQQRPPCHPPSGVLDVTITTVSQKFRFLALVQSLGSVHYLDDVKVGLGDAQAWTWLQILAIVRFENITGSFCKTGKLTVLHQPQLLYKPTKKDQLVWNCHRELFSAITPPPFTD